MKKDISLNDFVYRSNYDNLIPYLKSKNLETIESPNSLLKIFVNLEHSKNFEKIYEILELIADYHIETLSTQFKTGLRILINKG